MKLSNLTVLTEVFLEKLRKYSMPLNILQPAGRQHFLCANKSDLDTHVIPFRKVKPLIGLVGLDMFFQTVGLAVMDGYRNGKANSAH